MVASDASFANNSTNRKSSQAFAIKLFGGLIGWRANKQDTVITLTTEAKLLALAQAAKELMYVNKLLQKLIIDFND
jgi:Zn-dependent M16 (insulinase) family peptidase